MRPLLLCDIVGAVLGQTLLGLILPQTGWLKSWPSAKTASFSL